MTGTLACRACGAAWHTAAPHGTSPEPTRCLRCAGKLSPEDPARGPSEHPAASVVRSYCEAWQAGRIEAMLALAHPEVRFGALEAMTPERSPEFRGHAGLLELDRVHAEVWDLELRSDLLGVEVLDAERVLVHADVLARSSDPRLEAVAGHSESVWRVQDGLVTSVRTRLVKSETAAGTPTRD